MLNKKIHNLKEGDRIYVGLLLGGMDGPHWGTFSHYKKGGLVLYKKDGQEPSDRYSDCPMRAVEKVISQSDVGND